MQSTTPRFALLNRIIAAAASLAGVIAISALTGCASIVHHGDRTIVINTVPPGAQVTVTKVPGGEMVAQGVTPMRVPLEPKRGYFKGQSYEIDITKAGFQNDRLAVVPTVSGWYAGNILFGGIIGLVVVDPLTGAMWNLTPDNVTRTLSPSSAEATAGGPATPAANAGPQ